MLMGFFVTLLRNALGSDVTPILLGKAYVGNTGLFVMGTI